MNIKYLAPTNVGRRRWKFFNHLDRYILDEPLETAAFVFLFECQLLTYVTDWIATDCRLTRVEVLAVFGVEPHLDDSHIVLAHAEQSIAFND